MTNIYLKNLSQLVTNKYFKILLHIIKILRNICTGFSTLDVPTQAILGSCSTYSYRDYLAKVTLLFVTHLFSSRSGYANASDLRSLHNGALSADLIPYTNCDR